MGAILFLIMAKSGSFAVMVAWGGCYEKRKGRVT